MFKKYYGVWSAASVFLLLFICLNRQYGRAYKISIPLTLSFSVCMTAYKWKRYQLQIAVAGVLAILCLVGFTKPCFNRFQAKSLAESYFDAPELEEVSGEPGRRQSYIGSFAGTIYYFEGVVNGETVTAAVDPYGCTIAKVDMGG